MSPNLEARPGKVSPISSQDKVIDLSDKEFQWDRLFKTVSSALLNTLLYLYPGAPLGVVCEGDDGNSYADIAYWFKTSYHNVKTSVCG